MIRPKRKRKQLIFKCLAEILPLVVVFACSLRATKETLTPYFFSCLPIPTSNPGTGSKTRIPLSHSWKPMTSKGWSCDRSISQCFWRRKHMLRENKWTTLYRENQDICREQKRKTWKNIRKHICKQNSCPVLLVKCACHYFFISFLAAILWLLEPWPSPISNYRSKSSKTIKSMDLGWSSLGRAVPLMSRL